MTKVKNEPSDLKQQVAGILAGRGLVRFEEPVTLSSGYKSREFLDAKAALARGEELELACRALLDLVSDLEYDAIGGLTMGADAFAHVMAVQSSKQWFVVRKEPKGRGTNQLVEGATLGPGVRVVVVDDVITTGASILKACEAVEGLGARVVCAITLLDRGPLARPRFVERGTPYRPLLEHGDLGMEPVGAEAEPASTA